MRKALMLAGIFALSASLGVARADSREELIEKVESLQVRALLTSGQLPLVNLILGAARRANPAVIENTWMEIREETVSAMGKLLIFSGSDFDVTFRRSIESLSDGELQKISSILSDPIYAKYQEAIVAPSVMQGFMGAQKQMGQSLLAVMNKVLLKHGIPAMT